MSKKWAVVHDLWPFGIKIVGEHHTRAGAWSEAKLGGFVNGHPLYGVLEVERAKAWDREVANRLMRQEF